MPKVGMKPIRQSQLIEATLQCVAEQGLQATTINTISKVAGVSTGIINHYFGGKQGLLEATIRFLLQSLHDELMKALRTVPANDPLARLDAIIAANFANVQVSNQSEKTWMAFWAQSMHTPAFARLQKVNERRLLSNLKYSYRQLLPENQVEQAAQTTAALIDGLWLRRALSDSPLSVETSAAYCRTYVNSLVAQANTQ